LAPHAQHHSIDKKKLRAAPPIPHANTEAVARSSFLITVISHIPPSRRSRRSALKNTFAAANKWLDGRKKMTKSLRL